MGEALESDWSERRRTVARENEDHMEPIPQETPFADPSDGTAPPGAANRKMRATLRRIFQDSRLELADMRADADRHLRPALSQVCSDARHAGLRAEQLLVIIKEVWSGLPASLSRVQSVHGDERLNHVISLCVDEYYDGNEAAPQR